MIIAIHFENCSSLLLSTDRVAKGRSSTFQVLIKYELLIKISHTFIDI